MTLRIIGTRAEVRQAVQTMRDGGQLVVVHVSGEFAARGNQVRVYVDALVADQVRS